MPRPTTPRRHLPAALREASVLALLERVGELDVEGVAERLGLTLDGSRTYLTILERQGRIVSRLETFAEADARIAALPRVAFITRKRRRRLRYRAAAPACNLGAA